MNPQILHIIRFPPSGCDPEDDMMVAYVEKPVLDWDSWAEVRYFSVNDFDPFKPLWALTQRTARCCGTGRLVLSLAYSRSRLRSMATVLNAGTPAWSVARTDSEDEHGADIESYRVLPVEVQQRWQPPAPVVIPFDTGRDDWSWNVPDLDLDDDMFLDILDDAR